MARKKGTVTRSFAFEGKRYYVTGNSEVDAEVKKRLKMIELENNTSISSSSMLFKAWATKCYDMYKSCGEESIRRDWYIIDKHILPIIGGYPLKKIRPIDCQQVLKTLGDGGYSRSTIHHTLLIMNFIFSKAQFNDLIVKNPCAGIVEPPGGKTYRRALSDEEEKAFLNVVENERFRAFALMYYCGCRPEEARKAVGGDISHVEGYPTLHIRGTKSKNADRYVPIPGRLFEMIKSAGPDEPIAKNMAGKRHDDNSWKRAWKGLCRSINIEMGCKVYRNQLIPPFPLSEDLVPYCLRHTYCTNLQKQGVDIRTAQYLMGHSDIKLTANIYTHSGMHNVIAAAEVLSKK